MSPDAPFDLAIEHHSGWLVARVSGDLDLATAPKVTAAFDGQPEHPVAIDLSGIRFIDSTGAEVLEQIGADRKLVVVAPSGVVRRLLALTELIDDFEIVDGLDELEPIS